MALSAQQLQQIFAGGMTPSAPNMNSIYGGVLPSMGGGNPALNGINAAAPTNSSGPASWMAYEGGVPVGSSVGGAAMPPMPRPRPGNAPTSIDMAAINRPPGLTGMVPGAIPVPRATAAPTGYHLGDGLISLLTGGKAKDLTGLFGIPDQGGLLQLLFGGNRQGAAAVVPARARPTPLTGTARVAASMGLDPGSVSAMEAWHGSGPGSATGGGPAVGGSYGGS